VLVLTQDWLRSQRGTWRQDPKLSCGGQLNDSGSHVVDMMLWCTGLQAQEVYAQVNSFDVLVDVDSTITVRFTNGAIGNVTVLGSTPGYWEMFGIWGSEGGVTYDITSGLVRQVFGSQPEKPELLPASSDPDANFVRAILGTEPVEVPAECGLRVIELTEAAWRSAASGKPVTVGEM
jgi:predicted dehydrogenase